ncbi:MAG: bifunctional [glutamine synthetase] adenylyltransferase/[glutamine synthetase]-adenylyl-L-tyrosine phosphorylase, partial [Alphaproteobacteria bacterium]|nr:bifunctional [glutamine synthetase] adenylyltransferase/[glutamine synthetase]-adenylyl-L-tyrosine phosphorylase [Alphaproteobacteria bacterium]
MADRTHSERINFGKLREVIQPPNLIEIQITSYLDFLQKGIPEKQRKPQGLEAVFREVFPILSYDERLTLEYVSYNLGDPKNTELECLREGITYSVPLYVKLRLREEDFIKDEDIYMGEIPMVTERGSFIINGAERVVVSQLHRSPGIAFEVTPHPNGKPLHSFRIIPDRGTWLEVQFDNNDLLYVYLDRRRRRRKFLITTMLRAIGYSSDIDLILLYDRDAAALAGNDQVSRHFVRGARLLVQLMSETSADGYIFRTDLRLRPDPGSTPLAMSVQAAELYYESVGQNWERAAMIKAHPVAGNTAVGEAFLAGLRPYIWRKHLDFAAIHDIHSIKRQIDAHRGGGTVKVFGHNVKLGRGGIREIEFFAQTQQLIFGGRDQSLRLRGTCETIRALSATGHVTSVAAEELIEAYGFLRRVEHRLQMVDDRQTHSVPADEAGVAAIATFLGYVDSAAFQDALLQRLRCVEGHYARLFEEAASLAGPGGNLVFTGTDDDPGTLESLGALGFRDPSAAAGIVRRWHHGRYRATATARARELLTELMPGLLKELGATAAPDQALLNLDLFLQNLPAGVQLFSLFKANPALLELVAAIMGSAPGLAGHLARRTILLDSVLSPDFYRPLPAVEELAADLAGVLGRVDHEQDILDLARRWANDRRFQIGVQQLKHIARPAQAGLAYADVAAATISALCDRIEQRFSDTHGGFRGQRLAVLGLGKLGSREMSATSDLDLIFVYDIPPDLEASDGPQPLSPIQYYTRLSQKIVTALTAHTNEGALYEVDMRLRPSGRAGPLANSLEGFETYHAQSAWNWEHMALTRARVIHGPPGLVDRLAGIIKTTLCRPRDPDALVRDVADMRDRIARHAPARSAWDFKHLPGGLFDIDFVAQYLALRHAAARPDLLDPHPAEMLRRTAAAGLIAHDDGDRLRATRTLLSDVQSLLRLTLDGDEAEFDEAKAPEGQR